MYGNEKIANICNTKFPGLTLDNTLSWKNHTDTIIPKLSSASFAIRAVKPFLSPNSLRMVYYPYFHSIMSYVLKLGNSHCSSIIFRLQKRIIRIIVGIRGRDSCREHFKKLKILPLQSQYVLSLLRFVIYRDYLI
jgi:tRNA A58 N-methylase Trm61